MDQDRIKHLEFIQATVSRLASNSFFLKSGTVTLTAALFALAAKDAKPWFAGVALFPAFIFWGLDAYYLWQEHLFRQLYDAVRRQGSQGVQPVEPFSMSTQPYLTSVPGWLATMGAPTVALIHGGIIFIVIVVVLILQYI